MLCEFLQYDRKHHKCGSPLGIETVQYGSLLSYWLSDGTGPLHSASHEVPVLRIPTVGPLLDISIGLRIIN